MKTHHMITINLFWMLLFMGSAFAQEESAKIESAPAQSEPAQSAPAENAGTKSVPAENAKTQELLNKIEELEGKLNKLTEESSARKKLEITEQEKQEQEKQVLEAVGDEYTTESKRTLSLDYSLSYTYSPGEAVKTEPLAIDDITDHTIKHTISVGYALRDNLSVSTGIPFIYRYHKMGTDQEKDSTDIGDISLGVSYQPYKPKAGGVNTTFGLSTWLPTGSSPYDINSDTELSSGSGSYGFSVSANFSKQIDPVVAFWNVGYSHTFPITGVEHYVYDTAILEKVTPGDSYSIGGGIAYAMSYKISINVGFSYSYGKSTTYQYKNRDTDVKSGDSISAGLSLGLGWRVSEKTTLSIGLGWGLTGSGFGLTFRVPYSFVL